MVFAWNVGLPTETELYALSYADSYAIADRLGWTATASWIEGGRWSVTKKASAALREALAPHRMTPDAWPSRIRKVLDARTPVPPKPDAARWQDEAADSLAEEESWQALPAEAKLGNEGDPVAPSHLVEVAGTEVTLVVRSHTEGLGPKAVFGRVIGLSDVMSRRAGRLRPFPAVEVHAWRRRIVIPLNLVEDLVEGDQRARLGLPDPYDFTALAIDQEMTGEEYKVRYPH